MTTNLSDSLNLFGKSPTGAIMVLEIYRRR